MTKILVTGASGFIGRYVIDILQKKNRYDIHAIGRNNSSQSQGIAWHKLDLLDHHATEELISAIKADVLMHFAWHTDVADYKTSLKNFEWAAAGKVLIKAFYKSGGKRFVGAGTCAEYSWESGILSETLTPLVPGSNYGKSKLDLCRYSQSLAEQYRASHVWGRIFFIYGPHENTQRLVPTVIRSFLSKMPFHWENPDFIRDFIYVEDAADAFVTLIESPEEGAVNIASGQGIALASIENIIRNQPVLVHPKKNGNTVRPHSMVTADIQRLTNDFKWKPRYSMQEGISQTVQWWRKQLVKTL